MVGDIQQPAFVAPPNDASPGPSWRARPIRLVVVVDTLRLPAWVADVLREATLERSVALIGVGILADPAGGANRARSIAEDVYLSVDARRYARPDDPARRVEPSSWLRDVVPVRVPIGGVDAAGAVVLEPAAVSDWRDADAVWYVGTRVIAEPVPDLAPMGMWTLDPPAGAVGTRAMIDKHVATETVLRRLRSVRDGGAVAARVRTSTERISATVNRAEHLRHVAVAAGGWLRRLSRLGPTAAQAAPGPGGRECADLPPRSAPTGDEPLTSVDAVRLAARTVARLLRPRLPGRVADAQWRLAYHFADELAPVAGADQAAPATDFSAFKEIASPPDRYWADPFPVEHAGRHYVFFEEHVATAPHAHLSVAEFDPVRGLVNPRAVLVGDHHLSFPSVFFWGGAWYMTPEAATTGAVALYRATRFPDDWEHVADLVSGARFVDPVVARVFGTWWLFVGVMPPGTKEATALHLYHAPTPLGPWAPHLLNPVAVDVRIARPAGRVFARGRQYFRPVQDGAPHYGRAMAIHRIDVLTPSAFHETRVARVDPTWRPGLLGTHTLNAAGRLTMLDAMAPDIRPAPGSR